MTRKLNILTTNYLIFLILLFLSGAISGVEGEIVYYLAFAVPFVSVMYLTRNDSVRCENLFSMNSERIRFTLPLIAPTVMTVAAVSILTSLVIYAMTGRTNSIDLGDSFVLAIISHAILPALLEEMLFRYLPYRILAPHSKRCAVIVSAFFFALVHNDIFSIPYAFFAGVILMAIDLATGSVIPSIIIHFINNALSVGLIVYEDNAAFAPTLYVILAAFTLLSSVFILKKRKKYSEAISLAFDRGEGVKFTVEMLFFAVLTLILAFSSLL